MNARLIESKTCVPSFCVGRLSALHWSAFKGGGFIKCYQRDRSVRSQHRSVTLCSMLITSVLHPLPLGALSSAWSAEGIESDLTLHTETQRSFEGRDGGR